MSSFTISPGHYVWKFNCYYKVENIGDNKQMWNYFLYMKILLSNIPTI